MDTVKHILDQGHSELVIAIRAAQQSLCPDNPFSGEERARIRVIAVSTGVASKKTLAAEEPNMIIDNLTQLYAKVQELAE